MRWICATVCAYRVLVLLALEETTDNLVAYIGQHSVKHIEQEIMILKGAQLLDMINGQIITAETILQAIAHLNDASEKTLMKKVQGIHALLAKDPSTKFKTTIFCEDSRLSIERPGVQCKALCLKEESDIPTLTTEELQSILDMTSAFLHG